MDQLGKQVWVAGVLFILFYFPIVEDLCFHLDRGEVCRWKGAE